MANHLDRSTSETSFNPFVNQRDSATHDSKDPTQILLQVVQKLSLAKDLETIMFVVRKAARTLTGSDGATFVLRDGNQCFYADEDAIAPLWKGKRFPMSMCISGWVMENRQSVVINDIYSDPRIPADAYRPTFVKSLAMVPIRTSAPIGAIGTYWAEPHDPTEEEVNLLKSLADSTSIAMENIQLQSALEQGSKETSAQVEISRKLMEANNELELTLKELNRRNQEMEWLKELSSQLQTCLNIDEAYQLIMQYVKQLLPDVSGILYLMHPSRNYLESMISWDNPSMEEKIIRPDECWGLRRGLTYKIDDPTAELVCEHLKTNKKWAPYYCIPLFAQSDIIGLLFLEWNHFSKENSESVAKKKNQDLLTGMIAEQIAIGISNIKLRETLRNQSMRDTLTGLYNRRYLEETLERELSRCQRKSTSLALLMIDIDFFKQFNDKFGHEAGDIVLQAFANVLRKFARKDDIPCRYGGEEFIFVMPDIQLEVAKERAQALHEAVSEIHLRYGGIALTQITISIGLSLFPTQAETMLDLIAASDLALYQAKNTGRNKTVVYHKM